MPPLYITTQGAKLCYQKRQLKIRHDDATIAAVPAVHVSQVLIFGNVSVTTPALSFLLEKEIDTVFLTLRGRYKGRLVGPSGGNSRLRMRQYERASDPAWALETARAIVVAKLHNTRTLLRRYARRMSDRAIERFSDGAVQRFSDGADQRFSDRADQRNNDAPPPPCSSAPHLALTAAADDLGKLIERAGRCRTVNSLSGVEGRAAAIYFGIFRLLIQGDEWEFAGRNRRPPRDPVNALLSFGYTVLTHNVESAVRAVGLDPYIGFLHQIAYNRPSLALDLVEEFRPIVVDSVVLRCLNNNVIRPTHFTRDPDGPYPVLLDDEGRARFIRELEARLALTFKHPDSDERVTYRRCLELQARRLARCLQTGAPYRPFQVR